ncbi:MAG: ExbD/TolR family protein [Planctomycetota bacterium]|jgi:biopolymer transport protein ExbD
MSKAVKKIMEESAEMDMTPMIDIVFNLLIFFMIVTDLSQKDLANLTLPLAYKAVQDKADDPDDRLILNIDDMGRLLYKGKARTLDELGTILDQAKRVYNLKMRAKGKEGEDDFGGMKASKLYVLLRADRDTPWQHVQWIMTIMAEQKLYKLQFATKKYVDSSYRGRKWDGKEEWEMLDGRFQEQDKPKG